MLGLSEQHKRPVLGAPQAEQSQIGGPTIGRNGAVKTGGAQMFCQYDEYHRDDDTEQGFGAQ